VSVSKPQPLVAIRGGGDLATGVAVRLHRAGFPVIVLELSRPLAVRRRVAMAEAIYAGSVVVEGIEARRAESIADVPPLLETGCIPVLVDEPGACLPELSPAVIVDARMRKAPSELPPDSAHLIIGLGPGFEAGVDCHAVIETRRGHHLGRVVWQGRASQDTKIPEAVEGYAVDRVLRAPRRGVMQGRAEIGSLVRQGDVLATIDGQAVTAPFDGVVRGLLHDGVPVERGMKLGDLDPRREPRFSHEVSDKALAIGGAVLEAILSRPELRRSLAG
jgi:xanthine dehydrogenase accessory factor